MKKNLIDFLKLKSINCDVRNNFLWVVFIYWIYWNKCRKSIVNKVVLTTPPHKGKLHRHKTLRGYDVGLGRDLPRWEGHRHSRRRHRQPQWAIFLGYWLEIPLFFCKAYTMCGCWTRQNFQGWSPPLSVSSWTETLEDLDRQSPGYQSQMVWAQWVSGPLCIYVYGIYGWGVWQGRTVRKSFKNVLLTINMQVSQLPNPNIRLRRGKKFILTSLSPSGDMKGQHRWQSHDSLKPCCYWWRYCVELNGEGRESTL